MVNLCYSLNLFSLVNIPIAFIVTASLPRAKRMQLKGELTASGNDTHAGQYFITFVIYTTEQPNRSAKTNQLKELGGLPASMCSRSKRLQPRCQCKHYM